MERVNVFFAIDESQWPLVRIRYDTSPSIEELDAHHARMDKMYEREGWRAVLIEVATGVSLNAPMRRRQAEWLARQRAVMASKCAGLAFVLPSALHRGMLTAVLWIQPLPAPHCVVSTVEEAETWCRERLGATEG